MFLATGMAGLRLLFASVAAVILAFLVYFSTSWNLGQSTGVDGIGLLLPDDPSVTFSGAMEEFLTGQGASVAGMLPAVDRAARYDPIDARVFLLHAFDELQSGPEDAPIGMLEISRTYEPRLSETRILLLESYGKSGRANEALAEADALTTLLPADRALIVELVVQLILIDGSPEAMADALAGNRLRGWVMIRLAQRREDPELMVYLAGRMRGLARDEAERQWVGQFVREVAQQGKIDSARRLWASLHDVDEGRVGAQLLDPAFATLSGAPPFGWNIGRSALGNAEIRDGALNVFYYGRREGELASQWLMLEPGRYALRIDQGSPDREAPAGLSWQVNCAPRGAQLLHSPFARMLVSNGRPAEFEVPPDRCDAQVVRLVGAPSDVTRRQSATINSVRIERSGP